MKNLYLLLLLSLLIACTKEKDVEPSEIYGPCLITRIDESNGGYTIYKYDSNRRLESYFVREVHEHPFQAVLEVNYTIERDSENRISRILDTSGNITAIEYDAQGRWTKSQYGTTSNANTPAAFYSTTNIEYNNEGLITKTIATKTTVSEPHGAYFYSLALEYERKNLVKSTFDFTTKSVKRYEYYMDKDAKPTEVDLVRLYTARGSAPAGASPSKNLLKRVTTDDKATIIDDFTYEFNEHGYPTKRTNSIDYYRNPISQTINITYLCE